MNCHTRQDRIINDTMREKPEVSPVVENMIESRLAWLEIVCRRSTEALVRRVDRMEDSPIFRYNSLQDIMAVV